VWIIPFFLQQNQFLQLLNKDNNWVTFFVKSIIQDSAKKGYKKVLFPKGETAAKVEGHDTLSDLLIATDVRINHIKSNWLDSKIEPIYHYDDNDNRTQHGWKFYDSDMSVGNQKEYHTDEANKSKATEIIRLDAIHNLEEYKESLKSQGIEKLKPIEVFYEIKVTNVLKKNYQVNEVTDEYGNKWNEITLTEKDRSDSIFLS